jgi:nucleotide-binding universal stress UspA family protein
MENTVIPAGTVVVGLDGSPSSDQALDWAIGLARREHRQLTLAHGLEPMHEPSEAFEILERARGRCHDVAPDLSVHTALRKADPRVVLRDLGDRAAAVVVGSHGRGPVTSRLLGSVGLSVTRRAPCPVVVVRPHHPGTVRNGQASLRDLPLTILSVADDGLAVAEAVAGLAEKFPDVRSRTVVGDPADESARMDLVVVAVAHAGVVERAECPVAVVPVGVAGSSA